MSRVSLIQLQTHRDQSFRISLHQFINVKRKKTYVIISEVHRDGGVDVSSQVLPAKSESDARKVFRNAVHERATLESMRLLPLAFFSDEDIPF